MTHPRRYSTLALEAARLLGQEIKLGRKRRRWSQSELATRAGLSRSTVQKIERGDMTSALGVVFEAASLVGVALFDADRSSLARRARFVDDTLALLPKHTHKQREVVYDDF